MYKNELIHYGVKGQRWGIRRTAAQLGHKVSKKVKDTSEKVKDNVQKKREEKKQEKERIKQANKPLSKMTDSEIKERINRLELEKRSLDLQKQIKDTRSQLDEGERFIRAVHSRVITPALTDTGKKLLSEYTEKAGREALGLKKEKSIKDQALDAGYKKKLLEDTKRIAELESENTKSAIPKSIFSNDKSSDSKNTPDIESIKWEWDSPESRNRSTEVGKSYLSELGIITNTDDRKKK